MNFHLLALTTAMWFLGSGATVVAQGILDPAAGVVEKLIGGGVLATAAFFVVRWVRQTARDQAASSQMIIDQYRQQIGDYQTRVDVLTVQLAVAQQQLVSYMSGRGVEGTPI